MEYRQPEASGRFEESAASVSRNEAFKASAFVRSVDTQKLSTSNRPARIVAMLNIAIASEVSTSTLLEQLQTQGKHALKSDSSTVFNVFCMI